MRPKTSRLGLFQVFLKLFFASFVYQTEQRILSLSTAVKKEEESALFQKN
jgi:hypothetical protein